MVNFPKVSEVRFTKLIIHFVFVVFLLTFLTFFSKDLIGFTLRIQINKDVHFVPMVLAMVWLLFAIQSDKYQKQNSK